MTRFRISEKDNGFEAFFRGLRELGSARVKVGIQGAEADADHGGISTVRLAAVHEYGSMDGRIPSRSFLRSTADRNDAKYRRQLARAARRLVKDPEGFNARAELFQLGETVRADVIQTIKSRIPPPNALSTIRAKRGEDVPLIDTGQLINSITSVIE